METYKGMVGVIASERNKAWIEGALKNRSVRSMEAGGALLKPALSDLQRIAALTVVIDDDLLTEPQAAEALCEWAKNHGAPRQRLIIFSNSSRDADDPYFYRLVSDCDITDIFLAQLSGDPAAALDKLIDEPLSPMEYEQWKTHDPRIWEDKPTGLFGGLFGGGKKDKKKDKKEKKEKGKKKAKKGLSKKGEEAVEEDGLGEDGLERDTDSVSDGGSESGIANELPANDLPGAELPAADEPEDEDAMDPNGQGLVRRAGKKDKKKDKKKGGLFGGKGSDDEEPEEEPETLDEEEDEGLASNGLPMPDSSDEPAEAGSLYGDLPEFGDEDDSEDDDIPVDLYGVGDVASDAEDAVGGEADNGVADAGSLYGFGKEDAAGVAGGEADNGAVGAAGGSGVDAGGAVGGRSSQGSDRRDGGGYAGHAGAGTGAMGIGAVNALGADEVEDAFDKTAVMPAVGMSMQGTAAMPVVGGMGGSGAMAAVAASASGAFPAIGASGPMPAVGAGVSGQMPAISPSDSGRMMAVAAVAAAAEKAAATDEPTKMDLSDPDTVAGLWAYALEQMETIDASVVKLFKSATARPAAVGNGIVIEFPVSDKFCLMKVSDPESVGGLTLKEGLKLAAEGTVEHSLVLAVGEAGDPKTELAEESAEKAGSEAVEPRDGEAEIENPVKGDEAKGVDAEDAPAAEADNGATDAGNAQGLGKKEAGLVGGGEADNGGADAGSVEGVDAGNAADGRSSQGSDRREGAVDAGNVEGAVGGEAAADSETAEKAVDAVEDPKAEVTVEAAKAVGSEAVEPRDAEAAAIANPVNHEEKNGKEAPGHDKEEEPMAKEAKETSNESKAKGGTIVADPKAELAEESAEKAGSGVLERRDAEGNADGEGNGKKRNRNRKRNKRAREDRAAASMPEHASKGTFEISFPDDEAYDLPSSAAPAPSSLAPAPVAETFDLVDMIARGTQSLTLPTGGSVVSIASIRPGIGCTHTAVACGVSAAELGVAACVALRTRASLNAMARGLADCMAINGGHGIRWRGCDFYAWDEQRKYANDYEVCFADCGVLDPRDTGKNSPANLFMNHSKVKCLLAAGAPWDLRLLADLLGTIDRREVASWTIGMCSMDDDTEKLVSSIMGTVATEGTWRVWRQPFSPNVYVGNEDDPIRGIAAFAELMDPAIPSSLRPRVQADAVAASAKGRKKGKKKHHKGNGADSAAAPEDGAEAVKAEEPKVEADGKAPEKGAKPEAGAADAEGGEQVV